MINGENNMRKFTAEQAHAVKSLMVYYQAFNDATLPSGRRAYYGEMLIEKSEETGVWVWQRATIEMVIGKLRSEETGEAA